MNREEFAKLSLAIKSCYPQYGVMSDERSLEVWFQQLKDLDYKLASIAVSKHVAVSKFPPTIAEIREQCTSVLMGDVPDWSEGWEKVLKALRRYGWNREQEAMDSFDVITRKTVQRLGWMNLCMSEEISVERANFRNIYNAISEQQKKERQIPPSIMAVLESTRNTNRQVLEGKSKDGGDEVQKLPDNKEGMNDKVKKLMRELKEKLSDGK